MRRYTLTELEDYPVDGDIDDDDGLYENHVAYIKREAVLRRALREVEQINAVGRDHPCPS